MEFWQNLSAMKSNRLEDIVWAVKLVLLTMGTISTAILFKVVILPYTLTFIFSTFPPLFVSARSFLSPPFVYIIVNFIIITIAVSSNLQNKKQASPLSQPTDSSSSIIKEDTGLGEILHYEPPEHSNHRNEDVEEEPEPEPQKVVYDSAVSYNRSLDTNPALGNFSHDFVSPDEQCDDMEATWNAIMERQGKPVTWKLKKSETWAERTTKIEALDESHTADTVHVDWARRELKRSDNFNDTASVKREKSMSQEELYRKAEAFIQKVNNQIRLQRMESDQGFMDMVDGGVSHHYLVQSSI